MTQTCPIAHLNICTGICPAMDSGGPLCKTAQGFIQTGNVERLEEAVKASGIV